MNNSLVNQKGKFPLTKTGYILTLDSLKLYHKIQPEENYLKYKTYDKMKEIRLKVKKIN